MKQRSFSSRQTSHALAHLAVSWLQLNIILLIVIPNRFEEEYHFSFRFYDRRILHLLPLNTRLVDLWWNLIEMIN